MNSYPDLAEVSARLDNLVPWHPIGEVNWDEFPYRPSVSFNIAHDNNEIFIKYRVKEHRVKAEKTADNEMVCEDSCVEFFVSPEEDGSYYNIEFNSIGTCLMGYGTGRSDNRVADISVLSGIRRLSTLGDLPFGEKEGLQEWSLTVAIPVRSFFGHNTGTLSGKTMKANFYKCGDMLSVPHFVTWNRVDTKSPDYHRPEFFGTLLFE